jgi:hypothetical protein
VASECMDWRQPRRFWSSSIIIPHLPQDLANLTRNTVRLEDALLRTIPARPTPTQTRAFNLLGLKIAS